MATVITSPTYDPVTTATNLANSYVAPTKAILDAQAAKAKANSAALSTLGSALSAFQTAMASIASGTKSVSANSATFSNTAIATGTANTKATAGTYSFYVEQLATAGQVSYSVPNTSPATPGKFNIAMGDGTTFEVSLDAANTDPDSPNDLTAKEIAAAINAATGNNSRVTASTLTINGATQLVLSSTKTGSANAVASIQTAGLADPALATALSSKTTLSAASNAIVWVGAKGTGTKIEQATNTFSIVDGVSFTVNQAQGANDAPVVMKVASDTSATAANVQNFVTAYNNLLAAYGTVTKVGDPAAGTASAALAGDSAVKSLRDQLNAALRTATGGQSLISYGITASRDGTLSLDSNRLTKAMAADPEGLDKLFGRATALGTTDSGVLGSMNKIVSNWTSSVNGVLGARKSANDKVQLDTTKRLATLEGQFNNAYKRYLAQFTALQQLQSSMTNTSNLFTALFSSESS
ncbi:flagellar hook-associated protein 2 [Duganella sp. 3397]|uniref:Flagellar hook-associated protein 2 n=1 Tax=Duganella phyllosphaerae TaxID=762836 RepID=A0A1E7X5H2_9BURK|nr:MULTISPECIES: flagellar filament capping protein FliD [Duganella]MDR7051444.1 flagellar hook-associated protein 2 [Duganella sp. 3397]OFA08009.1 flagellar hook-associated protein 2 [Duganella phyllosphaerae]